MYVPIDRYTMRLYNIYVFLGMLGIIAAPLLRSDGLVFGNFSSDAINMLIWNSVGAGALIVWHAITSAIIFKALHHLDIFRVTAESELEGLDVIKHDEPAYAFGISMFSVVLSALTQLIQAHQCTLAQKLAVYQFNAVLKKHPNLEFFDHSATAATLTKAIQNSKTNYFYSMKTFKNKNTRKIKFLIKFSHYPKDSKIDRKNSSSFANFFPKNSQHEMSKCLQNQNGSGPLHCMILRGCLKVDGPNGQIEKFAKIITRVQTVQRSFSEVRKKPVPTAGIGLLAHAVNITLNPFVSENQGSQGTTEVRRIRPMPPLSSPPNLKLSNLRPGLLWVNQANWAEVD